MQRPGWHALRQQFHANRLAVCVRQHFLHFFKQDAFVFDLFDVVAKPLVLHHLGIFDRCGQFGELVLLPMAVNISPVRVMSIIWPAPDRLRS